MRPLLRPLPGTHARFWVALAAILVACVGTAATRWALDHPLPVHLDEANYIRTFCSDAFRFDQRGVRALAGGLLRAEPVRPPAHRLVAMPTVLSVGVNVTALRLTWITVFGGVLVLLFVSVRRFGGSVAGSALTVALLALSPQVLTSVVHIGTELPMYLATALVLFFVARDWNQPRTSMLTWSGLGVALGLGALAKPTFAAVAAPLLLLVALLSWRGAIAGPTVAALAKAAAVGCLIALPWWARNWRVAWEFSVYSAQYERHSLGEPSLAVWIEYLKVLARMGLGTMVAIVLVATVGARLGGALARRVRPWPWAVIVLIVAAVPLIGSQMLSINHGVRLVTPVFVFLAAAAGLAASDTMWLRRPLLAGLVTVALCAQAVIDMTAGPPASYLTRAVPTLAMGEGHIFNRRELWDFEPLRALCAARGVPAPSFALLGSESYLSTAQIRATWAQHGETIDGTSLWRWEQRQFSLDDAVETARRHDIALTAPTLVGSPQQKRELDNQYNAAFAERLGADPDFGEPERLMMGRLEPIELLVFFNRRRITERPASPTAPATRPTVQGR